MCVRDRVSQAPWPWSVRPFWAKWTHWYTHIHSCVRACVHVFVRACVHVRGTSRVFSLEMKPRTKTRQKRSWWVHLAPKGWTDQGLGAWLTQPHKHFVCVFVCVCVCVCSRKSVDAYAMVGILFSENRRSAIFCSEKICSAVKIRKDQK